MRIISMKSPILSVITKDLKEKRKSKKEIIDSIMVLKKQTPRGYFFNYLKKSYGVHEVREFQEALRNVQSMYSRERDLVDIYKELDSNSSLSSSVPDMSVEQSKFEKKINNMKLPMTSTVYFRINETYDPEPYIVLAAIVVDKEHRKEGVGSKFMEELVDKADELKAIVVLTPSSDFGGNVNKLRKFYGKFGFKRNLGRNKDYRFMEAMIRLPR